MSPPDGAGRTATMAAEVTLPWRWLDPWREAGEVETAWRSLEARFHPPWFLRWAWVENWLACLPPGLDLHLALAGPTAEPLAGCFIGCRRRWYRGLVPVRECHLNATGYPEYDHLWIEYNRILGAAGWADLLAALPERWDALHLPGLDADGFPGSGLTAHPAGFQLRPGRTVASPRVDLQAVRQREAEGGDYLDLLGRNTRSQIRRSWRLAEAAWGPVELEAAADAAAASRMLERLVHLHQQRWQERGEPGAFANGWFSAFHRRLVGRHGGDGVQLLTLRAGEQELGHLYNLVADGQVLFYQSGLEQPTDNRIKPGLMAHAAAIRYNAARGRAVYDFLGGESRYKQSLATGAGSLVWTTLRRPRLVFRMEDALRRWRRRWRASR